METPTKPLRGIELARAMLQRKRQLQQQAIEEYQNNPEVRATYEHLKEKNSRSRGAGR